MAPKGVFDQKFGPLNFIDQDFGPTCEKGWPPLIKRLLIKN
jgi:hypothetical protein